MADDRRQAKHEFIEHTAELALRLSAETPEALVAEACRALGAMLCEEVTCRPGDDQITRTVAVTGVDAEALLVDVLNELIFLAETERWAPLEARTTEWTPTRAVLHFRGTRLRVAPSRIKSATHHGLVLRRARNRWVAEVIFDV